MIAEANRIFGYDAWDRETIAAHCVWTGMANRQHSAAYTAKVRIAVTAGGGTIVREGCGSGEARGLTPRAHDLALKAAETDATKRALATFGNPFGLALYDRELAGVRDRKALERSYYSNDLAGAHRTRTTSATRNHAVLRSKSATNSPCRSAPFTTQRSMPRATNYTGGRIARSTRSKRQQISGHTAKVGFVRPPKQSPAL